MQETPQEGPQAGFLGQRKRSESKVGQRQEDRQAQWEELPAQWGWGLTPHSTFGQVWSREGCLLFHALCLEEIQSPSRCWEKCVWGETAPPRTPLLASLVLAQPLGDGTRSRGSPFPSGTLPPPSCSCCPTRQQQQAAGEAGRPREGLGEGACLTGPRLRQHPSGRGHNLCLAPGNAAKPQPGEEPFTKARHSATLGGGAGRRARRAAGGRPCRLEGPPHPCARSVTRRATYEVREERAPHLPHGTAQVRLRLASLASGVGRLQELIVGFCRLR